MKITDDQKKQMVSELIELIERIAYQGIDSGHTENMDPFTLLHVSVDSAERDFTEYMAKNCTHDKDKKGAA